MMRITILIGFIFLFCSIKLFGQTNPKHVYVKPYSKSDGTYVPGYYRTAPNNTNTDNFSTKGNVNPYNGKAGWIEPDNKNNNQLYPTTNNDYLTTRNKANTHNTSDNYMGSTNSLGQKVISYTNGQEVFGLCSYCSNAMYLENQIYYWYTPNSGIQKTKGGASGILLDGDYKFINERGSLLIKEVFNKGVEDGDYIFWDEDGNIKEKGHYTNGILDYIKFTNEEDYNIEWKGRMFSKGSIKNVYTKNGTLLQTAFVITSLMFHYKNFYEYGGKIKSEYTSAGAVDYYDGSYKTWYQNGNPKVIGHFTKNFKDGDWKYFKEDSSINVFKYKIYKKYDVNGKLKLQGSQYFDKYSQQWVRDGKWIFYKANGEDWEETKYYEDGIEVEKK